MSRVRSVAVFIGIGGSAASIIGARFDTPQFFKSYLVGWLFWLGLALGCFGLTMLHHLVGGRWGFATRRFLRPALRRCRCSLRCRCRCCWG